MPRGLCTQGGDMDIKLSNFHPAAFRQVSAQQGWAGRAGVQRKVNTPLVPSCQADTFPWEAYGR